MLDDVGAVGARQRLANLLVCVNVRVDTRAGGVIVVGMPVVYASARRAI